MNSKVESYLSALERELANLSTSERAEILLEIKSHIQESLETEGTKLEDILKDLGTPKDVAVKYLVDRGVQVKAPVMGSAPQVAVGIFKWLTIGFLGTLAFIFLIMFVVIKQFTPLVQVNDEEDKVKLFGGLIDVMGDGVDSATWKNLEDLDDNIDIIIQNGASYVIARNYSFEPGVEIKKIDIEYGNGKLSVENHLENGISFKCKQGRKDGNDEPKFIQKGELASLQLFNDGGGKCEVSVPPNLKLDIQAGNGKVELDELVNPMEVKLENGKILFEGDNATSYKFDIDLGQGKADSFTNSNEADALAVNLRLKRGRIVNKN